MTRLFRRKIREMLRHIYSFFFFFFSSLFFLYYIFALFGLVFCIVKMPFKVTGVIGKLLGLGCYMFCCFTTSSTRGMRNQRTNRVGKREKRKGQKNRTLEYGGITKVRNMIGKQRRTALRLSFFVLMLDRLRVPYIGTTWTAGPFYGLSRRLVK